MDFKKQVCSLELAKKLKELGVKQNSFWAWYETIDRDDTPRLNRFENICPVCTLGKQSFEEIYSAFTVAELGEMLPRSITKDKDELWLFVNNGFKRIGYQDFEGGGIWQEESTEADARAKMLCFLLENKLIMI